MAQLQRVALAPGPAGTSCLTCKRRHKKCDLRRPVCGRCEKGGFECLGYSHNRKGEGLMPSESTGWQPNPPTQYISSDISSLQIVPSSVNLEFGSLNDNSRTITSIWGNEDDTSPPSSSPCSDDQTISTTQQLDYATMYSDPEMLMTWNHQPPPAAYPPSKRPLDPASFLQSFFTYYSQVPYSPHHLSKTLLDSAILEDYVTTHCSQMLEHTYFKPIRARISLLQNSVVSRRQASNFNRWIVFLCVKICEAYVKGDTSQNENYDLWLCQMEQVLKDVLTNNLAPRDLQDRLGNWLEVILLKAMIFHSSNTYRVLQNATPIFLQMLFSEPTLWPSNCDPTAVPLANVIASRRHELVYFTLIDITAAMALGVPQQVEYNTSLPCPPNGSVLHEWMHGTPIEFQIILAEINACRDKNPNARDWKYLEHKLITWQARPNEHEANLDSWMVVAWFAVQESWRHTLLAYLYLAVCGASSDDPRIQSSVRQIFSVLRTIKKRESSDVNVPLFVQCLVAGICSRSEKHRLLARQQLANVSDITPRLMRAVDFVPVLDHLWHGAAANGRPVTWNDYMCSREAIMSVLT